MGPGAPPFDVRNGYNGDSVVGSYETLQACICSDRVDIGLLQFGLAVPGASGNSLSINGFGHV